MKKTSNTEPNPEFDISQAAVPGFWRRMVAIGYDLMLLFSVWFFSSFLVLPFTGGEAVATGAWWYQLYLLGVTFLFYAWFWVHGGQTLGMRAWRMKVVMSSDGSPIGWPEAGKRFLGGIISTLIFGMGFIWIWLDEDNRAWHDRFSQSHFIMLKKREKKKRK